MSDQFGCCEKHEVCFDAAECEICKLREQLKVAVEELIRITDSSDEFAIRTAEVAIRRIEELEEKA